MAVLMYNKMSASESVVLISCVSLIFNRTGTQIGFSEQGCYTQGKEEVLSLRPSRTVRYVERGANMSPLIFCPPVGNLQGEGGAAERTVEDMFIRRFVFGTFHGCLANELVIKRRGNMLIICALMLQKLQPNKYYFLIGYTEELLSHFYKCPVKMEVQTLEEKTVYKYL